MNYIQKISKVGLYSKITISSDNGNYFSVIPEAGARLNNLVIKTRTDELDIIEGYKSAEELMTLSYSKSSFLAPFPNRIADGRYTFDGEEYQLIINKPNENNAIHGFVSDKEFSIVRSGEKNNQHEIVLEHSTTGNVGFPFPFIAQITYLFGGDFLSIKTSVTNIDTRVIPFGFGWHPYFTLNNKIDENKLRLPRASQLLVDDRLIPTGDMFENFDWEQPRSIESTIFDTGFKVLSKDKQIILLNPEKNFGIEVDLLDGYEYFQIFTPPDRESIAIEPMTCAANAFNNGLGLRTINPKDSFSAEFRISTFSYN